MSEAADIIEYTHIAPAPLAARLEFTPEQREMIKNTFARGATDAEFAVLMEVASLRRLNPFLQQIYFVKRSSRVGYGDAARWVDVWAYQVSIDGLRAIAERTRRYDGQDEAEYEYEPDGKTLRACRVRVYKKGISRPFVGRVFFSEYVQTTKGGGPTKFWAEKPHVMIAKCAEAVAFRKAFPEDMSGLYVAEELQAEPRDLNAAVPPPAAKRRPDPVDAEIADALSPEPTPQLPEPSPAQVVDELIARMRAAKDRRDFRGEIKALHAKLPADEYARLRDAYNAKGVTNA